MKFTCSVEIDLPVDQVFELFGREDERKIWQAGLVRIEHLSGVPGEVGAKSKIVFRHGKGEMVLIETILVKRRPEELTGLYEHTHMVNTMCNRFRAVGPERTRYEAEIEYTQFNGWMPRLMARLMPGMFKKNTQRMLDRFKTFAEGQLRSVS